MEQICTDYLTAGGRLGGSPNFTGYGCCATGARKGGAGARRKTGKAKSTTGNHTIIKKERRRNGKKSQRRRFQEGSVAWKGRRRALGLRKGRAETAHAQLRGATLSGFAAVSWNGGPGIRHGKKAMAAGV